MYNEDVVDLYNRTSVGTKVVVTGKSFVTAAALIVNDSGFGRDVFASIN
jgi:hypothetical protein